MRSTMVTLLEGALWAIAFIVAALLFKGHPVGEWVQGALFVGFLIFMSDRPACGSRGQEETGRRP